jgi:chloramphenicol 3-O-phosphotransferase
MLLMNVSLHNCKKSAMKSPPFPQHSIFILSGTPGAGKSTIARLLMHAFDFGIHIPVDEIREWVASGIAHPIPTWTEETERQFRLARWSALQTATIYAEAGFTVALDDVVSETVFQRQYQQLLHGYRIHKVLLSPRVETALERNATRTNKPFDTAPLVKAISRLHEELRENNTEQTGWLVVDSSNLSPEETVAKILEVKAG